MTSCGWSVASSASLGPSVNCTATPGTTRTSRRPAVSPTLNGTSVSCSSSGTWGRVTTLSQRRADRRVRIGRRRRWPAFPTTPARSCCRSARSAAICGCVPRGVSWRTIARMALPLRSVSVSRFSTVMPCFFRASLVMVFSISAKACAGSATSRTKTPFCVSSKPGKLVAGCQSGRRHQAEPRADRENRVRRRGRHQQRAANGAGRQQRKTGAKTRAVLHRSGMRPR